MKNRRLYSGLSILALISILVWLFLLPAKGEKTAPHPKGSSQTLTHGPMEDGHVDGRDSRSSSRHTSASQPPEREIEFVPDIDSDERVRAKVLLIRNYQPTTGGYLATLRALEIDDPKIRDQLSDLIALRCAAMNDGKRLAGYRLRPATGWAAVQQQLDLAAAVARQENERIVELIGSEKAEMLFVSLAQEQELRRLEQMVVPDLEYLGEPLSDLQLLQLARVMAEANYSPDIQNNVLNRRVFGVAWDGTIEEVVARSGRFLNEAQLNYLRQLDHEKKQIEKVEFSSDGK